MSLEIELTPRADTEIKEIFAYLGEQDLDTAIDFYHAVFQSCERLAQFPRIGPAREYRHSRLRGLRMWTVQGYEKYLIFYQVTDSAIRIVSVIHATQDPTRVFNEDS
jgi:toxin ParE1/3/4